MRTLLSGLFILIVASSAVAEDKIEPKKMTLYPLVKGTKWDYEVSANGMTQDVTMEVTKVTTEKGKRDVHTVTTKVADMNVTEEVSADAKGVYRHAMQGQKLKTPLTIIKYPNKVGAKWKEKAVIGKEEIEFEFEALKQEEIKVAAGKYKAFPIKLEAEVNGQKVSATSWYVEDVGMVKQETEFGPIKVTMELKKLTKAKKDE